MNEGSKRFFKTYACKYVPSDKDQLIPLSYGKLQKCAKTFFIAFYHFINKFNDLISTIY